MCSRKLGPPHMRPAPLGAARGPLEGLGYTQAVPAPLCLHHSHLTRENLENTKEFSGMQSHVTRKPVRTVSL